MLAGLIFLVEYNFDMPIRILSDEVASQIAAGEVVERPASVVKELLENSLDAGAKNIEIFIEKAGKSLIEVRDDGSGIPANEVQLSITRHATSKLQTADDLFHIQTLGFRGEALASVGSISRMTLITRSIADEYGTKLLVEGGKGIQSETIGAAQGTDIFVENLFFNVPARLKFLKQDLTERQQIDTLVSRYALAYPDVKFVLVEDGRKVLQTSGNGDRREILAHFFGVETAKQMLQVELTESALQVTGYISPLQITRSNRKEMIFFVNGRWVLDYALSSALMQAYSTMLMVGRFPISVLFINIDPTMVDVNVHPTKAEVRFRSPDQLFSVIQRAARRALLAYSPVPQFQPITWPGSFAAQQENDTMGAPGESYFLQPTLDQEQTEFSDEQPGGFIRPSGQLPLLRVIGQIGATYLVAEGPDGLYLIDQHAAHERILFEKFKTLLTSPPSQRLLQPAVITLPPDKTELLNKNLDILDKIGVKVELFGQNTFRVFSLPVLIHNANPEALILSIVNDFEEDETPLQNIIEDKLIARICKRAAVKGGQVLSSEEQLQLIKELEACQAPRTCPHGRPTMIHLSVDLLEKQFGRRGAR